MSNDEVLTRKCWPHAMMQPLTERVYAGCHESSLYLGKGWNEARKHFTVVQFFEKGAKNGSHKKAV